MCDELRRSSERYECTDVRPLRPLFDEPTENAGLPENDVRNVEAREPTEYGGDDVYDESGAQNSAAQNAVSANAGVVRRRKGSRIEAGCWPSPPLMALPAGVARRGS